MFKKVITGIGMAVVLILTILIIMTFHGRDVRETELENSLSNSMESAMKTLNDKHNYTPESNEEFAASFVQAFLEEIDSTNISVDIDITDIDYQKGLLKAEVSAKYKHPIGTTGTVSAEKTMILEKYKTEEEATYYSVEFLDSDGTIVKTYRIMSGGEIMIPYINDNTLKYWQNTDDSEDKVSSGDIYTVLSDKTYMAVKK